MRSVGIVRVVDTGLLSTTTSDGLIWPFVKDFWSALFIYQILVSIPASHGRIQWLTTVEHLGKSVNDLKCVTLKQRLGRGLS